jgi:hypothetical protein
MALSVFEAPVQFRLKFHAVTDAADAGREWAPARLMQAAECASEREARPLTLAAPKDKKYTGRGAAA